MEEIKVTDRVLITVKRNEVIGKVLKIEGFDATCSFFMPRSKGMSIMKFPLSSLRKADDIKNIPLK